MLFLMFVAFGTFAVWMLLRLCLAFPASVVEQAGAWNALKRGTRLSEGTRGRILVLYILGILLNQILAWVVVFPAMIVLALIPGLQGQAHARLLGLITTFCLYGAMFAVRALTKPVYGIGLTLFYFDQRIRKEGFDIEWMMQQAGMTAVAEATPSTGNGALVHPSAEEPRLIEIAVKAHAIEAMEAVAAQPAGITDNPNEASNVSEDTLG
jgi:hypothetical protein